MSNSLPDYKRNALEKRLAQLLEEYQAVNGQRGRVLSAVDELRLERQAEALEQEIEEVRAQLGDSREPQTYDLAVVRQLLLAAFTAQTLRRFCMDRPQFHRVVYNFGPQHGLNDMVDEVIDYCHTHALFDELLAELQKDNPRQYEQFAARLVAVEVGRYSFEVTKKEKTERSADDSFAVLRVQLSQLLPGKLQVRGLNVPGGGQPKAEADLPFLLDELPAILKALDVGEYVESRFKAAYKETLKRFGLLSDGRLHPDFYGIVGRRLYDALFSGEILTEFKMAERSGKPVACQLCFDPEGVILAQYPWELIHDGSLHRVPVRKGVELTRYMTFANPPTPLQTSLPLRILFISPRPEEDSHLESQLDAILESLEPLRASEQLTWQQLEPPTWEALEERLYEETFDVIHFDGHGSFARECPACGLAHFPSTLTCSNPECKADMSAATPQGYLHFEDDDGHLDRVDPEEMQAVLAGSETRLILLSACNTCVVKGTSVFNGLAPALIQAGIPAVVAMQASPPDESSVRFVKRFYESLAKGSRLPVAANDGRRAIYRPRKGEPVSWFMPVVYLRDSDGTYGRLFDILE